MTINNIYIDFAKIYLDGSACGRCTWQSRCASESSSIAAAKRRAQQLEKTIKEMNDELARNAKCSR